MTKFLTVIISFFEFVFYTLIMVLVGEISIENETLKLLLHFTSLLIISIILYFLIKFTLKKLSLKPKKYLYLIPVCNLILGTVAPTIFIMIIPNKTLIYLALISVVGTIYYGLFINVAIILMNVFLTK